MNKLLHNSKRLARLSSVQFVAKLLGAILAVCFIVLLAVERERLLLKEALVLRNPSVPHTNIRINSSASGLEACLRNEFEAAGASAKIIIMGDNLRTSSHALVAGTDYGYPFAKPWVALRKAERIPFVYFGTSELRGGELPGHYARIPALLAARACLPNTYHLIYCDTDALLDWPGIVSAANSWILQRKPLSISWRTTPYRSNRIEARTHFFVVHTHVKGALHVLNTWWYNGRNVHVQDQTVFNELYLKKGWFRNLVNLVHRKHTRHIELAHCATFIRERMRCMGNMDKLSRQLRKKMAGLQAVSRIQNTS